MSILDSQLKPNAVPQNGEGLRKWSVPEFNSLAEAGLFAPDERTELIEGLLYVMSPVGAPHSWSVHNTFLTLNEAFHIEYFVNTQCSVIIGEDSEPQPDVYVAIGPANRYRSKLATATDIVLVIEVSDSTIEFDKKRKGPMYASAGIPEYWIINIGEDLVEVYRQPLPDAGYASKTDFPRGSTVSPLFKQQMFFDVDSLLG